MFLLRRFYTAVVWICLLVNLFPANVAAEVPPSQAIIVGVKLGGAATVESEPKEFITIFNQSDQTLDLSNWRLEYAKAGFSAAECNSVSWVGNGASSNALIGALPPSGIFSIEQALTDSKAGAVRLIEETAEEVIIHDLVGWGVEAPCFENQPASQPSATTTPGESLQRFLDCEGSLPVDSNNNNLDWFVTKDTAYGNLGGRPSPDCEADTTCDVVVITEVLPNPAGADGGHEFIEIHNPTNKQISLASCGLQINTSDKIYNFNPGANIGAGEYRAFYDDATGLTLPNSSGGTIYLLSSGQVELQSVTYGSNLADDVAWARFGNGWAATFNPTPNRANKLLISKPCPTGQTRSSETGRCRGTAIGSSLKPCSPGQARNPATNRCRSILSAGSQLKPCKPGQSRNPATNRCRSTTSAAAQLKPCSPGQERNPATNRCRKTGATTSTLKPCEPGQERNPDTNRCRRVVNSQTAAGGLGTPGAIPTSPLSTGLVATTAGLALAYGVYEFRGDIRNKFELLRRYFTHSGPS